MDPRSCPAARGSPPTSPCLAAHHRHRAARSPATRWRRRLRRIGSRPAQPTDQDRRVALRLKVGEDDSDGLANDPAAVDGEAVLGAQVQARGLDVDQFIGRAVDGDLLLVPLPAARRAIPYRANAPPTAGGPGDNRRGAGRIGLGIAVAVSIDGGRRLRLVLVRMRDSTDTGMVGDLRFAGGGRGRGAEQFSCPRQARAAGHVPTRATVTRPDSLPDAFVVRALAWLTGGPPEHGYSSSSREHLAGEIPIRSGAGR